MHVCVSVAISNSLCVCVNSPAGWDNEKKISILHENFQTLKADDVFEEVIVKPPVRKVRMTERERERYREEKTLSKSGSPHSDTITVI